jgi:hypothetical protein
MSATTIVLLGIVGYVGVVWFVIALLTIASWSDEAAAQDAREVIARSERLWSQQGARFTAHDAEFLERLDRRAAREFESVGRRAPPGAG